MFSVISSASDSGGTLYTASMSAIRRGRPGSCSARGDRLTATVSGGTVGGRLHSRIAVSSTIVVSGLIRPVCSARWMKSPGITRPCFGWFQRTSASTPVTTFVVRCTIG